MRHRRLILGFIVLAFLLSLMVYSYQEYYQNSPQFKKYIQLFEAPEDLNNTEISFSAEIISVDTMNHTVLASIRAEPFSFPAVEIHTGSFDIQILKKGDLIDVIGVFHGGNHITARRIWLNEPWEIDLVYLRSLLAIPFVLYLFFVTWRLNTTTWCFERRKKDA